MSRTRSPLALLLLLALPAACRTAEEHRESADEEVYRILAERRAAFAADPDGFRIERPEDGLRERLVRGEEVEGPLSLLDCLTVAAENSRAYQDRRESLYLAALDLTLERYRFQVRETGTAGAALSGSGSSPEVASGDAGLGLTRLLGAGALVVSDIGITLFESIGSGDPVQATTDLSLQITQPLLRGFGRRVVMEPLTQAERDLVYEVRDFERFRRTFAFDVASRVYQILAQVNTLANEESNAESLLDLRERNDALSQAGQLSEIQADQARQDELRALNRVVQARQRLEALLDDFKFFLGLPIDVQLFLDQGEFHRLREEGLEPLYLKEGAAIDFALEHRLDHQTALDLVDDAGRRVEIAADSLGADLGLTGRVDSFSEFDQPLDHDLERVGWSVGLDLDLPIDRLPERNAYRISLISLDATRRSAEASADGIRADLRDAMRNLVSLRESFRIQHNAVLLAEQRVESTQLSLDAGRAQTRDLLEAREALVQNQNSETQVMVDYRLASLGLFRDLEALRIDEGGLRVADLPEHLYDDVPPVEPDGEDHPAELP